MRFFDGNTNSTNHAAIELDVNSNDIEGSTFQNLWFKKFHRGIEAINMDSGNDNVNHTISNIRSLRFGQGLLYLGGAADILLQNCFGASFSCPKPATEFYKTQNFKIGGDITNEVRIFNQDADGSGGGMHMA